MNRHPPFAPPHRPPDSDDPADRGSAVAEFAMVSVLVLLLFMSVVQICLWIYTRNLLNSATADAARAAALAEATTADVTARVADRLGSGLATGTKLSLQCTQQANAVTLEVRCTLPSPGFVSLLDGVMPDVHTVAHATREGVT